MVACEGTTSAAVSVAPVFSVFSAIYYYCSETILSSPVDGGNGNNSTLPVRLCPQLLICSLSLSQCVCSSNGELTKSALVGRVDSVHWQGKRGGEAGQDWLTADAAAAAAVTASSLVTARRKMKKQQKQSKCTQSKEALRLA